MQGTNTALNGRETRRNGSLAGMTSRGQLPKNQT
jgi:hypothetical protein